LQFREGPVKRTLVTGAAGFTGQYVADVLSRDGHEVHGLVNGYGEGGIPGFAELHEGNLCDLPTIRRIVRDVSPDHVIHLAAISFVAHSNVDEMYRVNIVGTRQLLEAVGGLTQKPISLLLASSANVYGNASGGVIGETAAFAPVNDYGATKVAMEYVASIFRPALPIIIARPFNYTGRGQSSQFVIPKIVEHVRARAPIIELGNVDVARDFSDVRMVADAYARLIQSPDAVGQSFNICSGRAVALREILDCAMELGGHRLDVQVNPAFVRSTDVRSLRGSPAKIERIIGALRHIPIEKTLSWMLNGELSRHTGSQ
jgi:nucleoside-diphosphate-sugar epimerase